VYHETGRCHDAHKDVQSSERLLIEAVIIRDDAAALLIIGVDYAILIGIIGAY